MLYTLIYQLALTGLSDTLHEYHLYHLQVQFVQGLQPGDSNLCLQLFIWFLHKIVDEPDLLYHVLWIDEAAFTSALNSLQSVREWVLENFVPFDALHFSRDLVSVFGPHSLDGYLTKSNVAVNDLSGVWYTDFLQGTVPLLLEDISLNICDGMWYLAQQCMSPPPLFTRSM